MRPFTRFFAIALVSFATLTACGVGGGGGGGTSLSNRDVVIDDITYGTP